MFKLSIKINWPRIDDREISFRCPQCRLAARTTLGRIERQESVVCRGCKANIRLKDQRAGARRFLRAFDKIGRNMLRLGG